MKTIYAIRCNSGESYVGASANLKDRWVCHRAMLRGGYHPNAPMQRAWNEHGEAAFRLETLEVVGKDWAAAEDRWMSKLAPLFNQMPGGIGGAPIDPEVLYKRNGAIAASWAKRRSLVPPGERFYSSL